MIFPFSPFFKIHSYATLVLVCRRAPVTTRNGLRQPICTRVRTFSVTTWPREIYSNFDTHFQTGITPLQSRGHARKEVQIQTAKHIQNHIRSFICRGSGVSHLIIWYLWPRILWNVLHTSPWSLLPLLYFPLSFPSSILFPHPGFLRFPSFHPSFPIRYDPLSHPLSKQ